MERAKSFSKIGINLDVNLHTAAKPKDHQELTKVLRSKSSIIIKYQNTNKNKQPIKNQLIAQSITRETLNTFQKCHTKVQNVNAIYNQKIQITKKPTKYYSMKKYTPPSYFQTITYSPQKQHQQTKICTKLAQTFQSQKNKSFQQTANQKLKSLNNTLKSKLLIPFEKQTQRPFYQKLKKMQLQEQLKPQFNQEYDPKKYETLKGQKLKKIHAFSSYSQHDLFNPQKIPKYTSEMNVHAIDPSTYKFRILSTNLKFDKFVQKIRTRYDRDCPLWATKLQYDSKESLESKTYRTRSFRCQTQRKMNEVKSKYPIRLAC